MNTREFEVLLAAIFLVVFLGFFFNSGIKNIITGSTAVNVITGETVATLQAPSEPYISINKNDYSTDKNSVVLRMFALDADECRFKNEGVSEWSSWQPYVTSIIWSLTNGLGEKTVYYQCRNEIGESQVTFDSIFVVS